MIPFLASSWRAVLGPNPTTERFLAGLALQAGDGECYCDRVQGPASAADPARAAWCWYHASAERGFGASLCDIEAPFRVLTLPDLEPAARDALIRREAARLALRIARGELGRAETIEEGRDAQRLADLIFAPEGASTEAAA